MHSTRTLAMLAACLLLLTSGCFRAAESWTVVEEDSLSEAEGRQFAAAAAARDALMESLFERLVASRQESGPAAAITVCKDVAPNLASEVGKARGVVIGRTSFRLRNPRNEAPAWARPFVDEQHNAPVVLRNDSDGSIATLFPIQLKAECLQCHGPRDAIQPDVLEALRKAYPQDNATGFQEGELRGWFHVRVPAAA